MQLSIETEREDDGRRMTVGGSRKYRSYRAFWPMAPIEQALAKAQVLALRVLAERIEHGADAPPICVS